MSWAWYVARPDELFIDIDRGTPEKLGRIGRRLRGGVEAEQLLVREMYLYPTPRESHFHMIVRMQAEASDMWRFAWELYLGSDAFRTCNNILRAMNSVAAADVLIVPFEYPGFYRRPDHVCYCREKHSRDQMLICPVAHYLGRASSGYFGSSKNGGLDFTLLNRAPAEMDAQAESVVE